MLIQKYVVLGEITFTVSAVKDGVNALIYRWEDDLLGCLAGKSILGWFLAGLTWSKLIISTDKTILDQ